MNNLLGVIVGALTLLGFWIYESLIFAVPLWFFLNKFLLYYVNKVLELNNFILLPPINYFTVTALLIIIKILRFDSTKVNAESIKKNIL